MRVRVWTFLFVSLCSIGAMAADQSPAVTTTAQPESSTGLNPIGQVIWAKGQVSASLPNKEKRILARRASIYMEDTLESDKSSTAQINFTDGSLLALAENTKLVLEKYNFNKDKPSEDSYVMSIAKGGLRTVTGEIGKKNPEGYKAKTPIATLTVAGTEYSIVIKDNNDTLMSVKSGKIFATNKLGERIELSALDQRYAMISAKTGQISKLDKLPLEFKSLEAIKLSPKTMEKTPAKTSGSGSGGFCVGK